QQAQARLTFCSFSFHSAAPRQMSASRLNLTFMTKKSKGVRALQNASDVTHTGTGYSGNCIGDLSMKWTRTSRAYPSADVRTTPVRERVREASCGCAVLLRSRKLTHVTSKLLLLWCNSEKRTVPELGRGWRVA